MIDLDQVFRIKEHVTADMLKLYGYIENKIGNKHTCFLPEGADSVYAICSINMHTRVVTVMYRDALDLLIPLLNDRLLEYNPNVVKDKFDWGD